MDSLRKTIQQWFKKPKSLLSKTFLAFTLTSLFATIHFFQRYGWTQATGRELASKDVLLIYSGYELLAILSVFIFLFQQNQPIGRGSISRKTLLHLPAAIVFTLLHNLVFSFIYYAANPAWQSYSFWLLFKDIAFNYFNVGLLFYTGALMLAELYDFITRSHSSSKDANDAILKVKDQSRTYLFPLGDISYFTSADNYVKVHCGDQTVLMRESMTSLEKRLDPNQFLRVHRTALVNRNHIAQIIRTKGETKLLMKDEVVLPLSRRRKEAKTLLQNIE